ncbi:apicoplast pyruvate carrier 1-like [Babylonia areolata]|uniref:apicoplast pyruvate carrier 1-like n=1 Tax=Babylonia areolata TaxID=304850 RepID=UPI003FD23F94
MTPEASTDTAINTPAAAITTTSTTTAKTPRSSKRTRRTGLSRCLASLPSWRAVVTVAACTLVEATLGVTYTTSNFAPYLTSYVRNVTGDTSVDYGKVLWLYNSLWLVAAASIAFMGLLEKRIPNRIFVLFGICLNAAAFFGTYWALQAPFVVLVFVNGVLQGFSQSILFPNSLNLALKWFPHRKGLVAGITMGGYGGGAFMWNQVVTKWINPHNLQPDVVDGENRYFTQAELLHRVPSCFLVLGGILTGLQLLCLLSFSYPGPPKSDTTVEVMVVEDEHLTKTEHTPPDLADDPVPTEKPTDSGMVGNQEKEEEEEESEREDRGVVVEANGLREEPHPGEGIVSRFQQEHGDVFSSALMGEEAVERIPEYSPLKIMTMRVTWTLWLTNLLLDYAFIFVVPFYKAFGQTFIIDDHLLALVASFASVFNAVGRPIWGLLADRMGYLPVMLTTQGILVVSSGTFLTTELVGSSAMFFVWVCTMFLAFSGIYGLQGPVLFSLFGPRNFIFVLGVISSTGVIITLTSALIVEVILPMFGWRGVFLLSSACALTAMLTFSSLLLSCGRPIPPHMKAGLTVPVRRSAPGRTGATMA